MLKMGNLRRPAIFILIAIVLPGLLAPALIVLDPLINSCSEISIAYAQEDPCAGCSGSYDAYVRAVEELERCKKGPCGRSESRVYLEAVAAHNRFVTCITNGCDTGMPKGAPLPSPPKRTDSGEESQDSGGGFTTPTWVLDDNICNTELGENCANSPNDCECGGEICNPDHDACDERGCVFKRSIGVLHDSEGLEAYRSPTSGDSMVEGEGRIHFPEVRRSRYSDRNS